MIGQARPLSSGSRKRVALTDIGKDLIELLALAFASRHRIFLKKKALTGDRHRLGNGGVQMLGQPARRFFRTRIGDSDHI